MELHVGAFQGLTYVQTLLLQNNYVSTLDPGLLSALSRCYEMRISNNVISEIQPFCPNISKDSFRGLGNLRVLKLDNNAISQLVTGGFEDLALCSELVLSSNSISNIAGGAFIGLDQLITPSLDQNFLSEIDSNMLTGLHHLLTINLRNNHLAMIYSGAFSSLGSLKYLYLGNNYLTEIYGNMWVGLQSLYSLQLTRNRIVNIQTHGLSHMPALMDLDLSHNYLRTLRADIFNPDDYPESNGHSNVYLDLTGNRFLCNTTLCWLIEVDIYSHDRPTCINYGCYSLWSIELSCILGNEFLLYLNDDNFDIRHFSLLSKYQVVKVSRGGLPRSLSRPYLVPCLATVSLPVSPLSRSLSCSLFLSLSRFGAKTANQPLTRHQ